MAFKFNPLTGQLDIAGQAAANESITKIATETISALKVIYYSSSTECRVSDNNSYIQSVSTGIALNAGLSGAVISILTEGVLSDPSFLYTLNQPLFLGTNGLIQTAQPASGSYLTQIGFGLGAGSIYIRIGNPKSL